MITACKAHITDNHQITIWDDSYEIFKRKCANCINLNTEYQKCFAKTKLKIEQAKDEKQFDFSETYIFGKINLFQKRLEKLIEMMEIIVRLNKLEIFRIEGIETINSKYQFLSITMRKKSYDFLDYRKNDFDNDFEEFKRSTNEIEV